MTELPRKFTQRPPANLKMMDLGLLLEMHAFLKDQLETTNWMGQEQLRGVYAQKLSSVKRAVEVEIFGYEVSSSKASVEGAKPEDIDLSQFDKKEGE